MSTPFDDDLQGSGLSDSLLPRPVRLNPGLGQALLSGSPDMAPGGSAGDPGYVTVYYYQGDGLNKAGHMGMGVNGGPSFGFDPAFDAIGAIPVNQPGIVDLVDPKRKVLGQLRIPVTSSQAQSLQKYMLSNAGTNVYNVAGVPTQGPDAHNCATFVNDGLAAAGLKVPSGPQTVIPALLLEELKKMYGNSSGTPGV